MRSRASARSVASMRLSLLRLTAAAGATAAVQAAAPCAQAADAVFGGTTRSADPIVLKADPKTTELRSIAISWRAGCSDGKGFPNAQELLPVAAVAGFSPGPNDLLVSRNAKGRFQGTQLGSIDLGEAVAATVVDVAGKLKPGRATGTISADVTILDKTTGAEITSCQTGKQSFDATRTPGVIYGGRTSQGEPLVVRLNAKRTRVSDMITVWRAPCTPSGGYFRVPDHFVNFSLKKTGAFGNPFVDDTPIDAGGKRHWDYSISGRVSKTKAKGALQVKVADSDAAGVATDACDTGAVTWKVATG
jgi:hypothetical protein